MDLSQDEVIETKKNNKKKRPVGRPRVGTGARATNQIFRFAFTWSITKTATCDQLQYFKDKGPGAIRDTLKSYDPDTEFQFSLECTDRPEVDVDAKHDPAWENWHFQGSFQVTIRIRDVTLQERCREKLPGIFIRPCHDYVASKDYSQKVGDPSWRDGVWTNRGKEQPKTKYAGEDIITDLVPWQVYVVKKLADTPDKRAINWIHEEEGGTGKSNLVKFLRFYFSDKVATIDACDHKDMVEKVVKAGARKMYLIDLPRAGKQRSSAREMYTAVEQIKNGMVDKQKYAPQELLMGAPHVWVFSNAEPDTTLWSEDRYRLWKIDNDTFDFTEQSFAENAEKDERDKLRFSKLASKVVPGSGKELLAMFAPKSF